jgi:hypothetical protein
LIGFISGFTVASLLNSFVPSGFPRLQRPTELPE